MRLPLACKPPAKRLHVLPEVGEELGRELGQEDNVPEDELESE